MCFVREAVLHAQKFTCRWYRIQQIQMIQTFWVRRWWWWGLALSGQKPPSCRSPAVLQGTGCCPLTGWNGAAPRKGPVAAVGVAHPEAHCWPPNEEEQHPMSACHPSRSTQGNADWVPGLVAAGAPQNVGDMHLCHHCWVSKEPPVLWPSCRWCSPAHGDHSPQQARPSQHLPHTEGGLGRRFRTCFIFGTLPAFFSLFKPTWCFQGNSSPPPCHLCC